MSNDNEKNNHKVRLLSLASSGWKCIFLLGIVVGIVLTETYRGIMNVHMVTNIPAEDISFKHGLWNNNVAVTARKRSNDDSNTPKKKKYAIAVYAETTNHLYGVMLTTNDNIDNTIGTIMKQWLKEGLIHQLKFIDCQSIILDKLDKGLWSGVFNKLLFFNLTEYEKVITLDCDIFIRQNIYHWFIDYDTPAACQCSGQIEWNSGAMVISPSTELFNALIQKLPEVHLWQDKQNSSSIKFDITNYNESPDPFVNRATGLGQQTSKYRIKTMPRENAILSSELRRTNNAYSWYRRNHIFDTVHLTVDKPWLIRERKFAKKGILKISPIICMVLYEFHLSIKDIHDKYPTIDSIYHYIQKECPDTRITFDDFYRIATATNNTGMKLKEPAAKKKKIVAAK
ncbi:hypothetical protein FRACYDRAFT_236304 [Fragilariopsis cylindrus CCMP1102]|uniref:Nucleotide-diphospho-sugar transferase domain-containing protein n=1 Tax=Fragilariopsis cylindrus CCMP1102 TaxID=635003 RepID=A0A1E7FPZ6_9STRA|nr:hypothetical protein FRACYDRAFT_236304 [Fragilariopsis cylindrus CCMP1102]|eukprot:OEU20232.1 hypothetical protein FRACYDRAFT_236304 [Fragilariopsis cylindrus CCMP1102]